MPTLTIPFSLPSTARSPAFSVGASAKDQQLINAFSSVSSNATTGDSTLYVFKRSGSANSTSIGTSVVILRNCSAMSPLFIAGAGQNLYDITATSLGVLGGAPASGSACGGLVGTKQVIAFPAASSGWYLWSDASTTNFPTFTGNRTSGSAVISGIASTTGIYSGNAISGTGIPASTRVLTVDSATQITMTANATSGAGTATTITKEAVAKILSANFPDGFCSFMEFIDGRFFADNQSNGRIINSKLNDPSTWDSADIITLDWGTKNNASFALSMFVNNEMLTVGCNDATVQHFRIGQTSFGTALTSIDSLNKTGLVLQSAYPASIGGSLYLLAATGGSGGSRALYKISGNEWQRVSDDGWNNVFSGASYAVLGQMENGLRTTAFIGTTTSATGVNYDPSNNTFGVITTPTAVTSVEYQNFTRASLSNLVQWDSSTSGLWTDSSVAFTMTAQTQPYALNKGKGFVINSVELLANTESSGSATLSISGDDYVTFRSPGSFDLTKTTKRVHRCGYYRNHAIFKVEDSGNNPARFQGLYVDWEPCSA